jgi:hypothetical protein
MPCDLVQSVKQYYKPKDHNNSLRRCLAPKKRNGGHGIQTKRKDDKITPVKIKKRRKRGSARSLQNQPLAHPIQTRSQKQATIRTCRVLYMRFWAHQIEVQKVDCIDL